MAAPWDFPGCAARCGSVGVVSPASSRSERVDEEWSGHALIGHDIHRAFADAVAWQNDNSSGADALIVQRDRLAALASTLTANDIAVVEATGNVAAVVEVIYPYVKQVVIANPKQVWIIAHANIKTDTIDVEVLELRRQLARLYAHLVASQRRQSAPRPAYFPFGRGRRFAGKHSVGAQAHGGSGGLLRHFKSGRKWRRYAGKRCLGRSVLSATASVAFFSVYAEGSAIQRLIADSRQPQQCSLIRTCFGNVPSRILR